MPKPFILPLVAPVADNQNGPDEFTHYTWKCHGCGLGQSVTCGKGIIPRCVFCDEPGYIDSCGIVAAAKSEDLIVGLPARSVGIQSISNAHCGPTSSSREQASGVTPLHRSTSLRWARFYNSFKMQVGRALINEEMPYPKGGLNRGYVFGSHLGLFWHLKPQGHEGS